MGLLQLSVIESIIFCHVKILLYSKYVEIDDVFLMFT